METRKRQKVIEPYLYPIPKDRQPFSNHVQFDDVLQVSYASAHGNMRDNMEDRVLAQSFQLGPNRFYLTCVMDGHSGEEAADLVAQRLTGSLQEHLSTL